MKVKILLGIFLVFKPVNPFDFLRVSVGAARRHAKNILDNSADTQCTRDLKVVLEDLGNNEIWAMQMADAAGKPTTGFLYGNVMETGNYDECLGIRHGGIRGKYCTLVVTNSVRHKDELDFLENGGNFLKALGVDFDRKNVTEMLDVIQWTWGVCIPASCTQNQIQEITNLTEMTIDAKVHMTFDEELCSPDDEAPLPPKAIFFICFSVFIVALMVLGTIYDVLYHQKQPNPGVNLLVAFSMYSNGKKIFSMQVPEENLGAVNGVRVFSMAWVILGHTYMFNLFFPSLNTLYIFEWKNNLSSVFVLGAPLAVDTFFTISGFLVIYLYLTATITKRLPLTLSMFYIHRILRLTPSLIAVILLYVCLLEHLGSGPYWFSIRKMYVENCERYWWSTIFYIQNYFNSLNECVNQSWYLAVDTQLYFLAPIILYGLIRRPRRTIFLLAIIFVVSTIAAFILTYIYNVGAVPFEAGSNYFYYVYHPTHIRCTAWIVGAVWGYALFKTKDSKLELSRRTLWTVWSVNLLAMWIVMYAHMGLTRYSRKYDPFSAGIFNALARPVWASGVCWIMYSCIKGYGGPLNTLLSLRPFLVICRLNYSMFLMHLPIMLIVTTQKRTAVYVSNLYCCFEFISYYILTVFVSVFWCLAFESPILTIEKYFFRNDREKLLPKNGGDRVHVVDVSSEKRSLN